MALCALDQQPIAVPSVPQKTDDAIVSSFLKRGFALQRERKHAEALTLFQRGLRLDPRHGWLQLRRAVSLAALHRWPEALDGLHRLSDQGDLAQKKLQQLVRISKASGLIDPTLAWIEVRLEQAPNDVPLLTAALELADHGRDLPRVAALATRLLALPQQHQAGQPDGAGPDPDQLIRQRCRALLGLADPATPMAIAALPPPRQAWFSAQLAFHHFDFAEAQALISAMEAAAPARGYSGELRQALELAERMALMEADLPRATALRERIRILLGCSADPQVRQKAGAEPRRSWRLELGGNTTALGLLAPLRQQPAAVALPAIVRALQQEPDSMALAMALLLRLRRSGVIGMAAPIVAAAEPQAIPRRFWLQRRHAADSPCQAALEERWRHLHPGWELAWVDHDRRSIAARDDLPDLVKEAAACVHAPAIRGDLVRLGLLWLHGGVAVDWNARPQCAMASLMPSNVELLLVQDALGSIGHDLMAARPGHPFVRRALERAIHHVLHGQGYSRWDISGACPLSLTLGAFVADAVAAGTIPAGLGVVSVHELRHWLGLALPLPVPDDAPKEWPQRQLFLQLRRYRTLEALRAADAPISVAGDSGLSL